MSEGLTRREILGKSLRFLAVGTVGGVGYDLLAGRNITLDQVLKQREKTQRATGDKRTEEGSKTLELEKKFIDQGVKYFNECVEDASKDNYVKESELEKLGKRIEQEYLALDNIDMQTNGGVYAKQQTLKNKYTELKNDFENHGVREYYAIVLKQQPDGKLEGFGTQRKNRIILRDLTDQEVVRTFGQQKYNSFSLKAVDEVPTDGYLSRNDLVKFSTTVGKQKFKELVDRNAIALSKSLDLTPETIGDLTDGDLSNGEITYAGVGRLRGKKLSMRGRDYKLG